MRTIRRVGITQPQVRVTERGETRDVLDTRLSRLVWELGFAPVPIANAVAEQPSRADDAVKYLGELGLDAVILSGGGDVGDPPARDRIERAVLSLSEAGSFPVLGICRGLQVMNVLGGGRLHGVDGHVATRHTVVGPLVGRREVNSFHQSGIRPENVAVTLEALAWAEDGTVEAVRHRYLPWTGLMWHPEREDPTAPADLVLVRAALAGEDILEAGARLPVTPFR
jgi:gamma-glutamyl-gamma-aminobutyrate hydrolase PuuD